MSTPIATKPAVNLRFSHMGLSVTNLEAMTEFYTSVMGFTITDRGEAAGMKLVFMSRDPTEHHQIVLATGRPENMPGNTANPQFGPSINQISFKLGTLDDLRDIHGRLLAADGKNIFPANHGIAWSVYAHDPEGNNLEFYVDSDWYISQPFLIPLDLEQSDDDIFAQTKSMCENSEGFQPYEQWRNNIAKQMTQFVSPKKTAAV